MMDLASAAQALGGRAIGANVTFARVTTDSRSLAPGDLFVALKGERFDGHDYVAAARERGAVAAVVEESRAASLPGPLIAVDDPQAALGRLAAHWRSRFDVPVAVVVGSNGKTTVKEMLASVLRAHHGNAAVLATAGNLNNAIGLPLTVLALRETHRAAIIELGMNHRGETRELASIAQPTIALVNNAQREHQEFMASVAQVAEEHGDAIAALPRGGVAVINADDAFAAAWRRIAKTVGARVIDFGLDGAPMVSAQCELLPAHSVIALATPAGAARVTLAVPGLPMARNALAATAAAIAFGVPLDAIVRGLDAFRPVAGRLAERVASSGARVIDDTYNANPDSVRAAIDVLARVPGQRWLVLGDMGEVGAQGEAFHREIGAHARDAGIERLLAAGPLSMAAVEAFGPRAQHHESVEALAEHVARDLKAGTTVLVKGSRFMRMERVVAMLTGGPGTGAH